MKTVSLALNQSKQIALTGLLELVVSVPDLAETLSDEDIETLQDVSNDLHEVRSQAMSANVQFQN